MPLTRINIMKGDNGKMKVKDIYSIAYTCLYCSYKFE